MTVDARAARGMGWSVLEKWSSRFVSLGVLVVLGRLLDPADFGLVALATVFMTFLNIFVDQGLGRALVQRRDVTDAHADTAFWMSVVGSVVLAGLLVVVAPALAQLFREPQVAPIIATMALGVVLYALSSVPQALLERDFEFKSLARRRMLATLVGGVAAIIAAAVGAGAWSLVLQSLLTSIVGVVVLWTAVPWRPGRRVGLAAARELWPIGFGVVGIEIVGFLNSQSDRLLIAAFLDATALGYYFFAMRIVSIAIELFTAALSSVSFTTFSRVQHDRPLLAAWVQRLTRISCLLAMPAFAVLAATGTDAVVVVFGEQWAGAGLLLQILSVLGAVNAVAAFDRNALLAVGKPGLAFLLTFGQAVVGVVFIAAALPFGVVGVAIAVSVRQLAWWPVRVFALSRAVGVHAGRYVWVWVRSFVFGVLAAGSGYALVHLAWPLSERWLSCLVATVAALLVFSLLAALGLRDAIRELRALLRGRSDGAMP